MSEIPLTHHQLKTRKGLAQFLIAALIATVFVLLPSPINHSSMASSSSIVYNDGVCDLLVAGYLGDGSVGTPYQISDSDALWEVSDCGITNSSRAHFILTQDIDASEAQHAPTASPIGSSSALVYPFSGVLDGDNRRVFNIDIDRRASSQSAGLFASLSSSKVVNLSLHGEVLGGGSGASDFVGALASNSYGHLDLVSVSNFAAVQGNIGVGGLLGYVQGTASLSFVVNHGEVAGFSSVGGLIGLANDHLNAVSSSNFGQIDGYSGVGGLFGTVGFDGGPVDVTNLDYEGKITSIGNSNNAGVLTAHDLVGGLVGLAQGQLGVYESFNTGRIESDLGSAGGLVGASGPFMEIVYSYNSGAVSTSGDASVAAGLVGFAVEIGIFGSYNSGSISGSSELGGLVGYAENAELMSSHNTGEVNGQTNLGGMVGFAFKADFDGVYNVGSLTGTAAVGGLIGEAGSVSEIARSYNEGRIRGTDKVGGLVGQSADSVIMFSYNVGSVEGINFTGGLIGSASQSTTLSQVYNAGSVSGVNDTDGLMGKADNTVTKTAVFTSVASTHAVASTLQQMRVATTFAGFDFVDVWGFGSCVGADNSGLPMLRPLAQLGTYSATGCVELLQNQPEQERESASESAQSPTYLGPSLTSISGSGAVGQELILVGRRFGNVTAVKIGEAVQSVTERTETSLRFTISATTRLGVNDLVLESGFGTLTALAAITIVVPVQPVVPAPGPTQSPEVLLKGQSRLLSLNSSVNQSWFQANLLDSRVARIVCSAAVAVGATNHQRIQARKLAIAACEEAASYLVGPAIAVQSKETAVRRAIGKVLITVRG